MQGVSLFETYALYKGWLLLYKSLADGKRQGLQIALPGDAVGYQPGLRSLMQHGAVALTDCTFCAFPPLEVVLSTHSGLAARMVFLYARQMALKDDYLTYIAQRRASACLAFLVLDLYHRLQHRGLTHGNSMPFPLTQEDMGAMLGLTSVHINRVLHQWRGRKWIEIKQHQLTILNYSALGELAGIARTQKALGNPGQGQIGERESG